MVSSKVQVCIRVRPPSEGGAQPAASLRRGASSRELDVSGAPSTEPKRFTFDQVFWPDSSTTQQAVFDAVGRPVVDSVLDGYNGSIIAYGQTCSGKTHTMMGPRGGAPELLASDEQGLVPRALRHLLDRLGSRSEQEVSWSLSMSVFELYNEQLIDLLTPKTSTAVMAPKPMGSSDASASPMLATSPPVLSAAGANLRIREDRSPGGRGVFVENLSSRDVRSAQEALAVIQDSAKSKHMGATASNETSSRSHTIVQLFVAQVNHVEGGTKTASQLVLVDLAGSERADKTGAVGQRMKEAQNINLSLSLLGNVINKLTDGKSMHIPYRDSQLTRLLQDSLGGNACTTLICACSPMLENVSESLSTLQFANRAKAIENQPRANKEFSDDELRKQYGLLLEEVVTLKARIAVLEANQGAMSLPSTRSSPPPCGGAPPPLAEAAASAELRATIDAMSRELRLEREDAMELQTRLAEHERTIAFYKKRETEAAEKVKDMKSKLDREKLACDSWSRKFQELLQQSSGTSGGGKTDDGVPASLKRATSLSRGNPPAPPPKPVTPRKKARGGAAVGRGQVATGGGPSEANAPVESKDAVEGGEGPPQVPDPTTQLAQLETAVAQSLVRERMQLSQIDELKEKVGSLSKFPILLERFNRDAKDRDEQQSKLLEQTTLKYEALLKRQDDEIVSLQLKLDQRASKQCEETDEVNRLRQENDTILQENRNHAQRMLDFVRKLEAVTTELAGCKDDRDTLRRDIEASNMSGELKLKLLGRRLVDERSTFRKKLLDCFSRDEGAS